MIGLAGPLFVSPVVPEDDDHGYALLKKRYSADQLARIGFVVASESARSSEATSAAYAAARRFCIGFAESRRPKGVFVNEAAEQEYRALPDDAREAADASISALQNNGRLTAKQLTALAGKLVGVSGIRIPFDSDTYRVYFVATYAEVIGVLDAGMKRSPLIGEMPTTQKERLIKRRREGHFLGP